MMVKEMTDKILDLVEALYPDFKEYAVNEDFHSWMEYACELDEIRYRIHGGTTEEVVAYLNARMAKLRAASAEHNACVDVASNLEETFPQFKGVFKYE